MKYGIIGSGSANPKVVQEGLLDITNSDEDATFVIHARRSPQGAVGDVYDFLIDEEVRYDAVHRIDDNAPKILLDRALNITKTEDPVKSILDMCDKVLLLWDEDNPESSEKLAILCADAGKKILDLTMALTPIVIEGEPTMEEHEPVKEVVQEDVQDSSDMVFSRDELMSMNIGVLRRQAKALGIENVGKTKEEIVDAIFHNEPVSDDSVVASIEQVATETIETLNVTEGQLNWIEDGVFHTVMLGPEFTKRFLADLRYKPI